MTRPLVLLTGANGFLGSRLAHGLKRRGNPVLLTCREGCEDSAIAGLDVERAHLELTDARSVRAALRRGADLAAAQGVPLVVLHNAALISYRTRDRARQEAINVEGTRSMLAAAEEVGAARFVHISSVAAVGVSDDGSTLDETSRWNLHVARNDYCTTKRAAEELVLGGSLPAVVTNPGAIFGAGARGANTVRFLERIRSGRIGAVAPPGTLAVVGVEDVVEGTLLALERGRPGERFLLTESCWPVAMLFRMARKALTGKDDLRPRTLPAAAWRGLLVPGARVLDALVPQDLAAPQALDLLGRHFRFDSTKARTELGWNPVPFETVLRETAEDLLATSS